MLRGLRGLQLMRSGLMGGGRPGLMGGGRPGLMGGRRLGLMGGRRAGLMGPGARLMRAQGFMRGIR